MRKLWIVGIVLLAACEAEASTAQPDIPAATALPATAPTATVAPATSTSAPASTTAPFVTSAPALPGLTAVVVDGDTIDMSDGTRVRLIGIDTPEGGECGSDEASALIGSLIAGQIITLVPGARVDMDRYGRLLRYVEVAGVDVDLAMIESGRAIARYDGRDGYGEHPRQAAYVAADEASPSLNECPVAVPPPAPVFVPIAAPIAVTAPSDVYYQNCDAVRAAGADPIRPGDPGWQTKFDANHDGVGCERR